MQTLMCIPRTKYADMVYQEQGRNLYQINTFDPSDTDYPMGGDLARTTYFNLLLFSFGY